MAPAQPQYPQAFKRKAVELMRRGDRTQQQLAQELGTSARQLRRWLRAAEAQEALQDSAAAGKVSPASVEVGRLKRRIAQLEEANQALSEANRFFAVRRQR